MNTMLKKLPIFVFTLVTAGLLFSGVLYADSGLTELTPADTAPLTQADIDIFCKYCELMPQRIKTANDISYERLARVWREAGWTENRAGVAISRISTMYAALVENDEAARNVLEFMAPTGYEMDLVIENQESLAHALSLLEKYKPGYAGN